MTTLEQITKFLNSYHGLESNIPFNHPYWELLNDFRAGRLNVPERTYQAFQPETKAPPSGTPGQITARMVALRNQNRVILQAHSNREPNIPYTNEYWFTQNVIRGLERELAEIRA